MASDVDIAAYSGETGITALPQLCELDEMTPVEDLQRPCAEFGGNRSVFSTRDDDIAAGLALAYPLSLRIKDTRAFDQAWWPRTLDGSTMTASFSVTAHWYRG
ncbi:hypothetical protein ONR75_27345 [Rhodopseudomonas sp. P2A-2r]|uniref:hypothetical protein n=1 Tax=Rhodopseudomonas sp. P2A-2r TaxID=2991972 RepID=UPI0022349C7D|nr:hypothetical protein [Rhodopseudomonas sp. P2A-2r]UZE48472.1 hypothetical protein ONR75_27345 [Rhodopseudomonas sp. P2A-2r]